MSMQMRSVVAGAFPDHETAERAVHELHELGYTGEQIGVAARDHGAEGEQRDWVNEVEEQSGSDALSGVAAGSLVGGLLGAGAALVIPGVGPALAAGILAGTVAGGAFAGGLAGPLVSLGMVEAEAHYFEERFNRGDVIVTVRAADGERGAEAGNVLRKHGGHGPEASEGDNA